MDPSFPLFDLPHEVILTIIHKVDERNLDPTFPSGPPDELINLSLTNKWIHSICRPLIWRSIRYEDSSDREDRFVYTDEYTERRRLDSYIEILQQGGQTIKVQELSIEWNSWWVMNAREEQMEAKKVVTVVKQLIENGLQVLFLKGITLPDEYAVELLQAIASAPRLSAVRFNQIDTAIRSRTVIQSLPQLDHIRTLQIMHGSAQLLDLIPKCPFLDSLLLWPSSRRLGLYTGTIKNLLPRLRLLSMDSVKDPSAFRTLADEIIRLSSQRYAEPLPLEELFIEGAQTPLERSHLISSLVHLPNLQRLALYQARNPTPTLFQEIYDVAPRLNSLTVVAGDCDGATYWPCSTEEYLVPLSQFKHLTFFASDRKTRPNELYPITTGRGSLDNLRRSSQAACEFDSFAKLVKNCPSVKEAVAIDQDVSEGTTGYFATFRKEKGKVRISQKIQTTNDFLVSYDRWVRVEED